MRYVSLLRWRLLLGAAMMAPPADVKRHKAERGAKGAETDMLF
jgi:hypothetical protein